MMAAAAISEAIRILVVDDNQQIRTAFARVLERAGYAITTEDDTTGAIARLADSTFDIVLTDLSLPSGTGLDILAAAHRFDPTLPVVFVTGTGDVDIAQQALQNGALRYLVKPVASTSLLGAIEEAARARAATSPVAQRSTSRLRALEGDLAKVKKAAAFDGALEHLWMAMQPVVSVSRRRVTAYEALVRSDHPTLGRPDLLIGAAEELGRVHDLGRKVRATVAAQIEHAPGEIDFLVNLHPADLEDADLYDPDAPLSAHASRVILEITERASLDAIDDVQDRIARLRRLGFRIAVDDLGAGYGSLSAIALIRPDLVKIDMSLVRDVDADPVRMRMVRAIGIMCRQLGTPWLCEGVETQGELRALVENGADLVQGYLLGRPSRRMEDAKEEVMAEIPRQTPPARPSQQIALGAMAQLLAREATTIAGASPAVPQELRTVLQGLRELLDQIVG
jgi:EAL domain-containing protein (putative c-di-GMP-specific phosphodiesterase class I)